MELEEYGFHIKKLTFKFKFQAGTSRGILTEKDSWFVRIFNKKSPDIFGLGECGPLPGLSPDFTSDYEKELSKICQRVLTQLNEQKDGIQPDEILDSIQVSFPSVKFGIETALLDLVNGGRRKIVDNPFFDENKPVSINGLVWMGKKDFMLKQVEEKIAQGYTCIKIKVGAIAFDEELSIIKHIRKKFSKDQIIIRLDANEAFSEDNVMKVLNEYSRFDIHSIEQPVKQGQSELMAKVCKESPIPIALDEELIGVENKYELLAVIRPQYIILKPTLIGGIRESKLWIEEAEKLNIGWWMTSLLEANIGLNAIAQLTSALKVNLPQGLGTGQLYKNNIPSPLFIDQGKLFYHPDKHWGLQMLNRS